MWNILKKKKTTSYNLIRKQPNLKMDKISKQTPHHRKYTDYE